MNLRPLRAVLLAAALTAAVCGATPHAMTKPYDVAHHAVSTANATAQRHFDEALTLLESFNTGEAVRRFTIAAHDDPHLAMAYWGIASAYGPNINVTYDLRDAAKAREALAQAHRLASGASEEERALIDALDRRYTAKAANETDAAQHRYAEAMAHVAKRYADDPDVATWYAESLMDLQPWDSWSPAGTPNGDTLHIVSLLKDVLARDPGNVQANHLYIHIVEASPHPQDALESARRLAALHLEAGAEHLVHMPAHIYLRVGDFAGAVRASNDAIAHFRAYLAGSHAPGHEGYLYHDAAVLLTAQMSAGMSRGALQTARSEPLGDDDVALLRVRERFHEWRQILAEGNASSQRRVYARALALAYTGDVAGANALYARLGASDDKAKLARTIVRAEITCARGDLAAAIPVFEEAVRDEESLGYEEPPEWYFPVRESLGSRLLQLHRPDDARRVFETDLARNPGNPRSLFGLARALDALHAPQSERDEAQRAFERAWANADVTLTLDDLG